MLPLAGCNRSHSPAGEVVIYTSVDEPVAAPILKAFEERTGIHVIVKTDTEATKSVGLAETLLAEKGRPRADVWWGNEVFHTIRLAEAGALAPYRPPGANDLPARFRDPRDRWFAAGLRLRVIAVNPGAVGGDVNSVKGLQDLADPRFKGKIAMCDPALGTAGGHVAALYVLWGPAKARAYFQSLRANGVKLVGGNSVVADEVGKGTLAAGLTDNDDVAAARRAGGDVRAVVPDRDTFGTLAIPTTVGLVAGTRHPDAAKKLIDYLTSAEVERKLVDAGYALATAREGAGSVRTMDVDYAAVAKALPEAVRDARAILRE